MQDKELNYKEILEKQGALSFVPHGYSMYPTLKHKGQSVIIKKKTERLEKYDVAFYEREGGKFVLHRVLEVLEDGYITCGDSQFTLERVEENAVFGKMTQFYKGKKLVEVDAEHKRKIAKFYKRKIRRKIKVKVGLFFQRIKNRLSRKAKNG